MITDNKEKSRSVYGRWNIAKPYCYTKTLWLQHFASINMPIEVTFPEDVLPFVDTQCNNDFQLYTDPPYFPVVEDKVSALTPKVALEIGAGIGRMSLYFFKKFNWTNTKFIIQDGDADAGNVQKGGIRYSSEDEFYNSFSATRSYLTANGLTSFSTLTDVTTIEDKVDFVYSFGSIGFHWHINLYLDKIAPLLNPNALVLFEIRAPKPDVDEETAQKYQAFYDSQLEYAKNHPKYTNVQVVDLTNYTGWLYRDKTFFLLLSPKAEV